jgi:LmbE family N-acetylglucosaminyl deacetylase
MREPLRLLAIFAHPDDESMGMGGTLAKYSAEGVETHYICASRGERGWFGPEQQNPGPDELENAIKELGMTGLYFLDYIDGDVDKANYTEAIGKIVSHVRRIQPQVIVTFPPDGNYGHPDHIAVGQFTSAAILCAADLSFADPQNLPAHRVSKLYYMVDSENFINLIAPFIGDLTFRVDEQLRGEVAWSEWIITTRVPVAEYCSAAWRAIQCHQSQLPSLGALAEMHEDAATAFLAMQGTFYRAFSLVNAGRKIETDLFDGL